MVTRSFTFDISPDMERRLRVDAPNDTIPHRTDDLMADRVGDDDVAALAEIVMGRPAGLDDPRGRACERRSVTLAVLAACLCVLLAYVDYVIHQQGPPSGGVGEPCAASTANAGDCVEALAP